MARRVLILLKDLDSQKELIASAASELSQWSKALTNGAFHWQFETQKTDASFTVISGPIIQGASNVTVPGKYLDPSQIILAAAKPTDVVALLYSTNTYRDTISVHNPVLVNGVTCLQLPISPQANKEGIIENLAHELFHDCYFVPNQKGANLVDDVHQHTGITDPRPQANYSAILLKLKPYWPQLTTKQDLAALITSLQQRVILLLQKVRDNLLYEVKKKTK